VGSLRSLGSRGLSLVELLVAVTILAILAGTAIPVTRLTVTHTREVELKESLRLIRKAVDRYYDKQDRKQPETEDVKKYPKTLEELISARCLRRIPRDPFCPDQTEHPPAQCWAIIASNEAGEATTATGGPFAGRPFAESPLKGGQEKENVYDVRSRSREVSPFGGGPYSEF
jgi:general secretion pathway protein G